MAQKKANYEAPAPASDKKKALETALSQIEKNFGKGAVMRLGDKPEMAVDAIPTGSLALDAALGIGGVPRGRIIEIYGPESSGKTTLALHILAEAQKQGGEVAFVDAEHALDPDYAAALGVDIDSMLVSQPDTGEQALEITDVLVRSGAVDVVVVDSVAALTPRAEIEGEMGDSFVGRQPRDHHRRQRFEVLCLRAHRHPAHRVHQGRRRDHRQPHPGKDRQEQGSASLPRGGV